MSKTIVTSYVNPDLDGVACAVAYAELLGVDYFPVIYGNPEKEVLFVFNKFGFELPTKNYPAKPEDNVILVDNSTLSKLPKELKSNIIIEIIDHRTYPSLAAFKNAKTHIELVGACATIIAEKFKNQSVVPSKKSAILLVSGIISNTLNFKAKVTTQKDKNMFSWLNKIAKLPRDFANEMFSEKSKFTKDELLIFIKDDIHEPRNRAGKMVSVGQVEMVNAQNVINKYKPDILQLLSTIKTTTNADIIFLSFVELDKGRNTFITSDKYSQKVLSEIFGIKFNNGEAEKNGLILRKEINPLIIKYLE